MKLTNFGKKKIMIQRIQSLFLLCALILTGSLFFLDLAQLATADSLYTLTNKGIVLTGATDIVQVAMPALALNLLLIVTVVVTTVSIFLYKRRLLQIRLCGLNLGLLLGVSVMIFFFGKMAASELNAELSFNWPLVAPLVSMVLVFLAIRAIGKDEALVRSLDRIR